MADEYRIRLLIAEDHPTLRHAFGIFFSAQNNVEVVGQAADTRQALPLVEQLHPDVILIGTTFRPVNVLLFIGRLCDESPDTKIVVLSSYFDPITSENFLEAGASKTIVKGVFASELLTIIQEVYHNGY